MDRRARDGRARSPSSAPARWACRSRAQFADHGWHVIAVDVQQAVVDAINEGRSHVGEEPGLAELVADGPRRRPPPGDDRRRRGGARRPTSSSSSCRSCSTTSSSPTTATWTRRSTRSRPGVHAGSLVIFETTLPVGDTRDRFAPRLEAASGLTADDDFFVAFSPERLYSGAALPQPGDVSRSSSAGSARRRRRAPRRSTTRSSTPRSCAMSQRRGGRVREARRHDLPRREHRPRQRVRPLRRAGRRRHPRGHRRGEQPAVLHIHQPGLGVGGHCIPVYPHFLLVAGAGAGARRRCRGGRTTARSGVAIEALQQELGGLEGVAGPRPRADLPRTASRSWPTRGRCR